MTEIFSFFLRLIELHVGSFRNAIAMNNNQQAHSRVVQVVLETLTGFVEWVSIVHIMAGEGRLLHILCVLLNDIEFQLHAAECLSQIVNRKGQTKDRKPLLQLFNDDAIEFIYRAVSDANGASGEQNYLFLKKMINVSGLSSMILFLEISFSSPFR